MQAVTAPPCSFCSDRPLLVGTPGPCPRCGKTAATPVCERCGDAFTVDSRRALTKRFCSRRCQNNAYHEVRKETDAGFHERALEYQRLWRVRERARKQMQQQLQFEETG